MDEMANTMEYPVTIQDEATDDRRKSTEIRGKARLNIIVFITTSTTVKPSSPTINPS
ncbi:hypothetical protein D1872_339760 [compost metagenome]